MAQPEDQLEGRDPDESHEVITDGDNVDHTALYRRAQISRLRPLKKNDVFRFSFFLLGENDQFHQYGNVTATVVEVKDRLWRVALRTTPGFGPDRLIDLPVSCKENSELYVTVIEPMRNLDFADAAAMRDLPLTDRFVHPLDIQAWVVFIQESQTAKVIEAFERIIGCCPAADGFQRNTELPKPGTAEFAKRRIEQGLGIAIDVVRGLVLAQGGGEVDITTLRWHARELALIHHVLDDAVHWHLANEEKYATYLKLVRDRVPRVDAFSRVCSKA